MSETATARARLSPYCLAAGPNGLDLGAGGDPILPTAISVDRSEDHSHRAHVGLAPTQLVGNVADLSWFRDGVMDYVYSSHTLEDAVDTKAWLKEWLRVLRPGGMLVLFLPDQQTYVRHCKEKGSLPNQAHIHADFSLQFVEQRLAELGIQPKDIVHKAFPVNGNPYSFEIVIQKP